MVEVVAVVEANVEEGDVFEKAFSLHVGMDGSYFVDVSVAQPYLETARFGGFFFARMEAVDPKHFSRQDAV